MAAEVGMTVAWRNGEVLIKGDNVSVIEDV